MDGQVFSRIWGDGSQSIIERDRRWITVTIFALYLGFIVVDLIAGDSVHLLSRALKFVSVCFCATICTIFARATHSSEDRNLLQAAMLLTVGADFVTGIIGNFMIGIALFVVVHILYIVRHMQGITQRKKETGLGIVIAIVSVCIMLAAAPAMKRGGLLIPSLIYGSILAVSLYAGLGVLIRSRFSRTNQVRIASGVALFFVTDVLVALYQTMDPSEATREVLGILVWVIYLPSQVLLAHSLHENSELFRIQSAMKVRP